MIRLAVSMVMMPLWMLTHGTANAFEGTGAELQRVCNQPKGSHDYYICAAYVGGVYDGMWAYQKFIAGGYKGCLPALTDDTVIAIVKKYMSLQPQALTDPMLGVVGAALMAEFPCK